MDNMNRRAFMLRAGAVTVTGTAMSLKIPGIAGADQHFRFGGMPTPAQIGRWLDHKEKAFGPTFTGSAAHSRYLDWLEHKFRSYGLDVQRNPKTFARWLAKDWSLQLLGPSGPTGIRVASFYPYSGVTGTQGVEGEIEYVGTGVGNYFTELAGKDLTGKIALFALPPAPTLTWGGQTGPPPWRDWEGTSYYLNDPGQTTGPAVLCPAGPALTLLTATEITPLLKAGAVGAIGIIQTVPDLAAGSYGPISTPFQGLPALWVDQDAGKVLINSVGRPARLVLTADHDPAATSDEIVAVLPGLSDEVIMLNSHSDGPNAVEENGSLGILAMVRYFASKPKSERPRTMMVYLRTGHFAPGLPGPTQFLAANPSVTRQIVATLTVEHLGTREWMVRDDNGVQTLGPTGLGDVQISAVTSTATVLRNAAIAAIKQLNVKRAFVAPPPFLSGEASPFDGAGIPTYAWIASPSYIFSWANNTWVGQIDPVEFQRVVLTLSNVVERIEQVPAAALKM